MQLWKDRSYIQLEKNRDKIIELLKERIKNTKNLNFIRGEIDYELLLSREFLKEYEIQRDEKILEDIEKLLINIEKIFKETNNDDIRNEAMYHKLCSILYKYKTEKELEKAHKEKAIKCFELINCKKDISNMENI